MAKKNKPRYPKSVAWAVDEDYSLTLSLKDRAWLNDFNYKYYNAIFEENPKNWNAVERRKRYSAKNAAARDIYTKHAREPIDEHSEDLEDS